MKPARYAIGDVVPIPADADLELAIIIQNKRGMLARSANRMVGQQGRVARKIIAGINERRAREADPIEQAKVHLRRRGFVPVYQDGKVFIVGRHRFDDKAALIEFAREKGWGG